jgi:hypothetical protein
MSAEIEHLALIAGKAGLLYATAIVGRIPSASDADYPTGAVTLIVVLFTHAIVSHLRHYSSVARLVDQSPKNTHR